MKHLFVISESVLGVKLCTSGLFWEGGGRDSLHHLLPPLLRPVVLLVLRLQLEGGAQGGFIVDGALQQQPGARPRQQGHVVLEQCECVYKSFITNHQNM